MKLSRELELYNQREEVVDYIIKILSEIEDNINKLEEIYDNQNDEIFLGKLMQLREEKSHLLTIIRIYYKRSEEHERETKRN